MAILELMWPVGHSWDTLVTNSPFYLLTFLSICDLSLHIPISPPIHPFFYLPAIFHQCLSWEFKEPGAAPSTGLQNRQTDKQVYRIDK